jgi:hypothetical protein
MMWKGIVESVRPQMTIWRMRIACWITKATGTHSEYVTPIAVNAATVVAKTRYNVTFIRTYIACSVLNIDEP